MVRFDNMQAGGLTAGCRPANAETMKSPLTIIAIAAGALLAGCNQEDHTIVASGPDTRDPAAEALEANGPIALPPSIAATKTYRCADNSIVSVDWLSDNKSANIRAGEGASPVQVTAVAEGEAMSAESGYGLSGTADAASARITLPGKPAQSCKA